MGEGGGEGRDHREQCTPHGKLCISQLTFQAKFIKQRKYDTFGIGIYAIL